MSKENYNIHNSLLLDSMDILMTRQIPNIGMDENLMPVIGKDTYNNLLDSMDILRIRQIIEDVTNIQQKDSSILDTLDPIERLFINSSNEEIKRLECIKHYSSISKTIDLLSQREGSIRNYFTNFPWDDLEKVGYPLKLAINEQDLEKYDKYKSILWILQN